MTVVGEAVVAVRPNLSPFKRDVESGISRIKPKPLALKSNAASVAKSLKPVRTALLGIGAAFAGIKVAGFVKDSIGAASDLNESLSKTRVVFGASSKEVEKFARSSATALGISRQAALEATSTFGNLFTAMKIGKPQAADMSQSIVTLASDLASFNNANPADVLESLRAGLVGEVEPLRKFGVNLNQAAIQQKALSLGLVKGKDPLTAAAKAQASYALILEQTKTAQGDFTRTSGGLANQQRILAANVENLKAKLGGILLPVVTSAIKKFNDWLPAIQKVGGELAHFIDTIRNAKDWKARISIVWDKISEAKAALSKALFGQDLFKGQQTIHMPGLIDNLKASFAAIDWSSIGATIATGLSAGLETAKPIASDLGKQIDQGVAAIRARLPELSVLGAEIIANLFVTLTDPQFWLNHWQLAVAVAISAVPIGKFGKVGELLVEALGRPFLKLGVWLGRPFADALGLMVTYARSWAPRLAGALEKAIVFAAGLVKKAAVSLATGAWEAVQKGFAKIPGIIRAALSLAVKIGIVQTAVDAATAAKNFGTKVYNGIADKVKTIGAKVLQFIGQIPGVITSWIGTVLTAASSLGAAIISGIVNGIKASPGAIRDALGGVVDSAISAIKGKLKINSPSLLFSKEVGQPISEGIAHGVRALSGKVSGAVSQAVKDAVLTAKQGLASLASTLSGSINAVLDVKFGNSAASKKLAAAQADQAALELKSQIADLQATIDSGESTEAERTKARADLAVLNAQQAVDAEQTKVDAAKAANERILADLAQALNKGLITQADYAARVKKLLADQGVDYKTAGDSLGLAFADGFITQLNDMLAQAKLIAKAGLPDLNALRSGITDPLAVVKQEISDQRAELTQVKKDARSKDSAGGTKITAAEQKRIDSETNQLKALQQLLAAMQKLGTEPVTVQVTADPNGFLRLTGAQVTAAQR